MVVDSSIIYGSIDLKFVGTPANFSYLQMNIKIRMSLVSNKNLLTNDPTRVSGINAHLFLFYMDF